MINIFYVKLVLIK